MTKFNESELKQKFNLPGHQIPFLLKGNEIVDFKNKRVLEVGGSLPRELVIDNINAKQWIGIEECNYWEEINGILPPDSTLSIKNTNFKSIGQYQILTGNIEDVPKSYYNQFDVVFSIATFEHINKLPEALDRMYCCLKSGGVLFSLFAPVWSSHDGHHLPDIFTNDGEQFNFSNNPIPPWGHLLMRPSEIIDLLTPKFGRNFAHEVIYYIYQSPHINRFMFDDYLEIFNRSKFINKEVLPLFPTEVPEDILRQLTHKYGSFNFSHNGMLVVLKK